MLLAAEGLVLRLRAVAGDTRATMGVLLIN
jgi:hypothetical protein